MMGKKRKNGLPYGTERPSAAGGSEIDFNGKLYSKAAYALMQSAELVGPYVTSSVSEAASALAARRTPGKGKGKLTRASRGAAPVSRRLEQTSSDDEDNEAGGAGPPAGDVIALDDDEEEEEEAPPPKKRKGVAIVKVSRGGGRAKPSSPDFGDFF